MNRILILVLFFISIFSSKAQIHELGVFLGGSNYIGDIGPTTYIAPDKFSYGLLYKWNRSPRHSYRLSYTQSNIVSDDVDSDMNSRELRGYSFENSIKELSLGFEFNFFEFNLHEYDFPITPYVHTGISYFQYESLYFRNGKSLQDKTNRSFAIPMTIGMKFRVAEKFVLGLESGIRYTFIDDLDGSNPRDDRYNNFKFGNIKSNDWYVFTGVTLTYTFGKNPCYCPE